MRRLSGGEGPEAMTCRTPPASLQKQRRRNNVEMRGAALATARAITSTAPARDASITRIDSVSWPVCMVWSHWSKISETQLPRHTTRISAAASCSSHPRIHPYEYAFSSSSATAQRNLACARKPALSLSKGSTLDSRAPFRSILARVRTKR